MIEAIACKLALWVKRANPEETGSVEVMAYALAILIHTLAVVALSLAVGWTTGKLADTAWALASFGLLRLLSGGRHVPSLTGCLIVSVAICASIPHIAWLVAPWTGVVTSASLALILYFAPLADRHTRFDPKHSVKFKLASALLVCANYWFQSGFMGLAFLIQSITVISFKRR